MIKENFIGYTYLGDRGVTTLLADSTIVFRLEIYTPSPEHSYHHPDHGKLRNIIFTG
jgi:hypothetical protein